ncbi:putative baseplate assembly protein [Cohnella panacarvi]|uniref:putative baseplate assembly protein n=1 Tax=Cohnella panacarvi TaxID=400776 RepID=UPI00047D159C|nr:putative baseplate assembly protein [Cohnella panacarvi]
MLPRLPLDDRTFESMVKDARRGIPQQLPEWTDENAHDPGVTMLELFAWLSEMQQYYLSRVPERNVRKFLDLLGVAPSAAIPAEVDATFGNVREAVFVPGGSKLQAEDQAFETAESVWLLPLEIERIVTRTEREASDMSAFNADGNVAFYAFGRNARAGSKLYIAFDRAPPQGESVSVRFRLNDGEPPEDLPKVTPSARVVWKYYGIGENGEQAWIPLELASDDTLQLTYSGSITFALHAPMEPVVVHPAGDRPRYWICCSLEEPGYERPPRIERILLHTVKARQQNTLAEYSLHDGTGQPGFRIALERFLAYYGEVRVQVRESDGRWREWREITSFADSGPNDRAYVVERGDPQRGSVTVRFGEGTKGALVPAGAGNVRVVCSSWKFAAARTVGRSGGLPRMKMALPPLGGPLLGELLIQVAVPDPNGETAPLFEDWTMVDQFDRSGPLDKHFVLDSDTMEIRFGDDENGAIPDRSSADNVFILACVTGGGSRGNIKPNLLTRFAQPEQERLGLTVTNAGYGAGGAEPETLQAATRRASEQWLTPYAAVTNEDYARIACETPGLRIARAHVIPQYAPGRGYSPGAVTVVVVPEGLGTAPKPSKGFLDTVARHLDDRRLITTEVHVIGPEYVQVTVHATVVVEPHYMEEAHRIVTALNLLLSPVDGPGAVQGWPFGRTVQKGDVYSAISRLTGVAYAQDLWLDAEGQSASKNAAGDIVLPPNGIVVSGMHQIQLVSRTQI